MANAYFYSNIASPTTLSGNINNSVTSCTVASTTGWPGTTPYIIALDFATANEELVKVTANAAGTLTIVRAFGGTSAVSHSTGAAVRHVYNAQDATDFRTHEAATSAAHGIAGSFVGTTDAQTLTNKTLTAPAISAPTITGGGSMAGTFSGTPTFSGAVVLSGTPSISNGAALAGTFTGGPTFSGTPTFSGAVTFTGGWTMTGSSALVERATASDNAYRARITADSNSRFLINADGGHVWGTGAATGDTTLARTGTSILGTTSTFSIAPTNTALDGLAVNLPTATVGDLLNLRVNSAIQAAMDSGGGFRIYGGNAPTTYTPTITNGGTVTWTTRTGNYWKMGKIVFITVYLQVNAAGSGASNITVGLPSTPDRTIRQVVPINVEGSGTLNGSFEGMVFLGGSGANIDRVRSYDGGSKTGSDLSASTLVTMQGWYREV